MKKKSKSKQLNFKHFVKNNFLSKTVCKKIINELDKFNKYDDLVMGGRRRINKGSKNFKSFLKNSINSKKFYDKINQKIMFLNLNNVFKKLNGKYSANIKTNNFTFSKSVYGAQTGKRITENTTDRNKNIVYLDIDFSISSKGYSRGPHRDRDSRVINFLIYLNNLSKKDGARLKLYNVKKRVNYQKKRFLSKHKLILIKDIAPIAGKIIFFESSPNSYHSVSNFYAKIQKKRYFIYGSYSLNKKVSWSISSNDNKQI